MNNSTQSVLTGAGSLLTQALNTLPFNGEKLKLALWVALLSFLQVLSGLDFGISLDPEISLPISLVAAGAFIVHKVLKRKFGYDAWGEAIK